MAKECEIEECTKLATSGSSKYCNMHYKRFKLTGFTGPAQPYADATNYKKHRKCLMNGCNTIVGRSGGRGYVVCITIEF